MRYLLFFIIIVILPSKGFSQDLEAILEQESTDTTNLVLGTFNGTRLLNGHSVETRKEGILEFMISHRFGRINSGFDQLFGLDESNIRFGLEYALTDRLTLALGRSSFEKTFDAYAKYRLLQQKTGKDPFPLSMTLLGTATEKTIKDYLPENKPTFSQRLTYTGQVLIARKFDQNLSIQFAPTYIHFNSVPASNDPHDMLALGFGARMKLGKRVSINGEYYYNTNPFKSFNVKNSIAVGVDIETGGHIFQLIFTNAISMIEKGFIAETNGSFFNGDIHFGFNISRAFQLKKSKR
ncbi:DUF5777 family beta-barrel protein [Flavobacteriaceae bacterium F89]|uniref:DUF5777 family beta-barrel protein n=1 Tax=Cerina litoralis TaxID=2874477 RepID=A0AAE3JUZ0_9FLAO|nr:DUF5777 family beta-barrel protein [Cerina litoralis]MCG2462857.1 DUF5777 family beta-barrel protein [Cerina litoralis]